jgi:hypothetical protein
MHILLKMSHLGHMINLDEVFYKVIIRFNFAFLN